MFHQIRMRPNVFTSDAKLILPATMLTTHRRLFSEVFLLARNVFQSSMSSAQPTDSWLLIFVTVGCQGNPIPFGNKEAWAYGHTAMDLLVPLPSPKHSVQSQPTYGPDGIGYSQAQLYRLSKQ